jgi:hypothetical protein
VSFSALRNIVKSITFVDYSNDQLEPATGQDSSDAVTNLQPMLFIMVQYQFKNVINLRVIRDCLYQKFHGHRDMVSRFEHLQGDKPEFSSLRK